MADGFNEDLLILALFVGVLGFLIVRPHLSLAMSLFVTAVKVMIPVLYFSWFSDGAWFLLDDLTYERYGYTLLDEGYTPFQTWFDMEAFDRMRNLAGGDHVLYIWWNHMAHFYFGAHYYSPVFLNVLLTFVAGAVFYKILDELNFEEDYRRWFLVFYLLHWDMLAWSSFINLKDILVMTCTTVGLYAMLRVVQLRNFWDFSLHALLLWLTLYMSLWVRFYIPYLFFIAFVAWLFFKNQLVKKYDVLIVGGFLFVLIIPAGAQVIGAGAGFFYGLLTTLFPFLPTGDSSLLLQLDFSSFHFGFLRFLLTPQPWSIAKGYSFLQIPSITHWILFGPMLVSCAILWQESGYAKLLLIYFLTAVLLFSVFPELQGPRHRVQVTQVLCWIQFHFLWWTIRRNLGRPKMVLRKVVNQGASE